MYESFNTAENLNKTRPNTGRHNPRSRHADPETPFLEKEEMEALADTAASTDHELDNPQNTKILRKLEDWWYQARLVHSENRYQMAIDEDFYDGIQWKEADRLEVEGRGQPALTFNQIKPAIDWVIGTERRSRIDFRVHPRGEEDRKQAQAKTHLMKYVDDVNMAGFSRSRAFSDAAKVGIGWLEDGIKSDPVDELIFSRSNTWRHIWYDHLADEQDLSDARYIFRSKWVDQDIATLMFPERADAIKMAAQRASLYENSDDDEFFLGQLYYNRDQNKIGNQQTTWMDDSGYPIEHRRERVRLIEGWYRVPEKTKRMYIEDKKYKRFNGQVYDEENDLHKYLYENYYCSIYDAVRMRVYVAIFVEGALLTNKPSPYNHDKFPFTPVWGYRRKRDGMPYGLVRNQRDPQEDLNKRRSKALFVLSTNQVIADDDAVSDWDELREEAAAPDGIIKKKRNRTLEINRDNTLAAQHVELEQYDKEYIREVSGVTSENLGHETNATSGKAINARQNQGSTVTYELFDNLRYSLQVQGQKRLSLIEQYYDEPKVIRIIGDKGRDKFLELNQPKFDEQGNTLGVENDITKTKADFVVDEQDYRETIRLAMFETLQELVGKLDPSIALQLLDLVIDMSDIPKKEELVARIREINGFSDPDAADTPEQVEQEKQKQAAKQKQQAMQEKAAMLEMEEQDAKIKKLRAEADKITAEANKTMAELQGLDPSMQDDYAQQVGQLKEESQKKIRELQQRLDDALTDRAEKVHEIETRKGTELEKARIDAEAKVKIAEINAASDRVIENLRNDIRDLEKKMREAHSKSKSTKSDEKG